MNPITSTAEIGISYEKIIASGEYVKEREYWLKKLSAPLEKTALPYDFNDANTRGGTRDTPMAQQVTSRLPEELHSRLLKVIGGSDLRLYMILVAAVSILLYKYTGHKNILLGAPALKQKVNAKFLNTVVVLRNQLQDHMSFKELILQVKDTLYEAVEHINYPLDALIHHLDLPVKGNDFPLFDIAVLLANIQDKDYLDHIPCNMTFAFCRNNEYLEEKLEYNSLLYRKSTVERVPTHLNYLLDQALTNVDIPLADLDIVTGDERKQLLHVCNDTSFDLGCHRDSTLHTLFENQVERTPDNIVLVGRDPGNPGKRENKRLTYKELNRKANQLARRLNTNGVKANSIVGMLLKRSAEMVIGILGIWKAGGGYLPISLEYPPARRMYILEDANVDILLSQADLWDNGKEIEFNGKRLEVDLANDLEGEKDDYPKQETFSRGLAYVIYTSGTTGTPKGVMITHRSAVNTLLYRKAEYKMDVTMVSLQLFAYSFDGFVTSLFTPVISGAKVVLLREDEIRDMGAIKSAIVDNKVTHFICVPALYREIINNLSREEVSSLEVVTLVGENLSPDIIGITIEKNKAIEICNEYGITEAAVMSTIYRHQEKSREVKIGHPIGNTRLYILNNQNKLQPIGVPGELCIAGIGLARGYLNNVELTAQRFTRSPLEEKEYIYRTGDLSRWLSDGNIEFLGRIDHQVKIRGFRIELKEIEKQLLGCIQVKDAAVVDRKTKEGEAYLCAYVVPWSSSTGKKPNSLDTRKLRSMLSQQLPGYMLPDFFTVLAAIPLTANGKVDRRALPEPEIGSGAFYTAPGTPLEKKIVEIWSEVLGIEKEKIGIDSSFFELGGHSLKATILIAKFHKTFNVKVSLAMLFRTPTIRELGEYVTALTEEKFIAIQPVEEKEYYALSSAQKRLYVLQEIQPGNTAYNLPVLYTLEGKWERKRLEETFSKLIHRHKSFRTSFEMMDEKPVQRIHQDLEFVIEYHDSAPGQENYTFPITNQEARGSHPSSFFARHFIRPFDLAHAPLLRVALVKQSAETHLLMVDMHHIITDGTSMYLVIKEFMALYGGVELEPLKIQYNDYSEWQNSETLREAISKQEEYWLKQFENEIPVLNLPPDYPRPALQSFEGGTVSFELSTEQSRALNHLAAENETTLYMVLLTLYNILLFKLSGQEDIVVGTPIAARRHADLERIIGMFVNTLAMRSYPQGEKPFKRFLSEIKETTLEAFENQEYQFEDLVNRISLNRDTSRNPLFDVVLALPNMDTKAVDIPGVEIPGLKVRPYENEREKPTAKFDLNLICEENDEKLFFTFEYCSKLFKKETIERFIGYFKKIVSGITGAEPGRISEMEIISEEEKNRILYALNDTGTGYPKEKTIHRLFEKQSKQGPDHIAAVGTSHGKGEVSLTYKELNEKSNRLAQLLHSKGVIADTVVGIMVERSPAMLIGLLGILKAGGAYLPMDPGYPGDRIHFMLADSNARILVSDSESDRLSKVQHVSAVVELSEPGRAREEEVPPLPRVNPANLAYVIYTSGTTGQPKGALIEHRQVVRLMFNDKPPFDFDSNDVWTMFHSYCFDFSVWEMYGALLYGGKLILISWLTAREPRQYLEILKREGVTVLNQTPAAFYNLTEHELQDSSSHLRLRYVIFGGESLKSKKLKEWKKKYPRTRLINMFGITETTVHVTFKELEADDIELNSRNIGKPLPTLGTYVMDKCLKLVPLGGTGELWVGGKGVGRGYLNRVELTAEKFLKNALIPGEKLYRTGDLVRLLCSGELEYIGRIDHQVKIRGFRIELGEIENQLLKSGIVQNAVVIKESSENEDRLICYLVPGSNFGGSTGKLISTIREYLLGYLPDYMIPSCFMPLEKLPLTSNGKVDRRALPGPEMRGEENYTAPRNKIEEKLVETWSEVLGIEKDTIGIDANFFALGGHSLKATMAAARIHQKFNANIQLADIFKKPTIRKLARYLNEIRQDNYIPLEPIPKKEYYALSSAQKRLFVIEQMESESSAYNVTMAITLKGRLDKPKLEKICAKLIERHESLRTSFRILENEAVQQIHEPQAINFKIEYDDLTARKPVPQDTSDREREIDTIIDNFIEPFNLSQAPLCRMMLIKIGAGDYILVGDVHHIIADGISMEILMRDISGLYMGNPLPRLKLQYKDYSKWQNRFFASGAIKKQEEYWLKQFEEEVPIFNLPTDYERPDGQSSEGESIIFTLEKEFSSRLKQLLKKEQITLHILIMAAYSILLSKYTDLEDIVVGSSISGRKHVDLENIIGMFVNLLALRVYPEKNKTFDQFLKEIKITTLKAYENQDYPFEELVKKLALQGSANRNPLFDAVFQDQNVNGPGLGDSPSKLRDVDLTLYQLKRRKTHFDLLLQSLETPDAIQFSLTYATALFKKSTVEKMTKHYVEILEQILDDGHIKLEDITISHGVLTLKSTIFQEDQCDFSF